MPKVDDETLRKRFEKAKEAWDERQKANRARQRREKALADARRKTVIGEMVLAHVQDKPHERERLMKNLDAYLRTPETAPCSTSEPGPKRQSTWPRKVSRPSQIRPTSRPLSDLPIAPMSATIPPSLMPCCVWLASSPDTARHSHSVSQLDATDMTPHDARSILDAMRAHRSVSRRRRYRASKLTRYRAELVTLHRAGASYRELALWLRRDHRLRV